MGGGVKFCGPRSLSLLFTDLQLSLKQFTGQCEAAGMKVSYPKSENLDVLVTRAELDNEALFFPCVYQSIYISTLTYDMGQDCKDKIVNTSF